MKWWGWGAEDRRYPLPDSAVTFDYLRSRLGLERLQPSVAL